jgi:hypothetical protein
MTQLPAAFNPSAPGQKGMTDFTPIPVGTYKIKMVDSNMRPNNAGTGEGLNTKWQVIEGEFEGRFLWSLLNLINPSAQTVEIAQKELKSICDAVGIAQGFEDTVILHNIPCWAKVGIQAATSQYAAKNKIQNYAPLEGADAPGVAVGEMAAAANIPPTPANPQVEALAPTPTANASGGQPPTPNWGGAASTGEEKKEEISVDESKPAKKSPPWVTG